jgi:hypothetical protein
MPKNPPNILLLIPNMQKAYDTAKRMFNDQCDSRLLHWNISTIYFILLHWPFEDLV